MNMQEIVIVAIGCFSLFIAGPLIWAVSSYKEKKLNLQAQLAASGAEETRAEMEALRQRVAVLERLLTDDDRRLANEISRLQAGQPDARR
jgi:cell division protein FtsB